MGGAILAVFSATVAHAQVLPASLPSERDELDGAIAGRVCADENDDGQCQSTELGVAGVRLVLATGQEVITDLQGRYHLAAIEARAPDALAGGRLLPGRHRLRLDERSLPRGRIPTPRAVTLEVPMAGLVRQDFAVRSVVRPSTPLSLAHAAMPPRGELQGNGARFLLAGKAAIGDKVLVEGNAAEVDAAGAYQAWVNLRPGSNELSIAATSRDGTLRLYSQRVDLMRREGSLLVVPRELVFAGTIELPDAAGKPAPTGKAILRIEAAPGTKVRLPSGQQTVGDDRLVAVPLELHPGENVVELTLESEGKPARIETLRIAAAPRPFAVGLLDVEGTYEPRRGGVRLFGRGAGHVEHPWGGWLLRGELSLADQDLADIRSAGAQVLVAPSRPDRLERALDPDRYSAEWADDSLSRVPNAAKGRLRFEARHEVLGALGFGSHRALFADAEIGRYQRELFGPYIDLSTPSAGPVRGGVSAFFAPGLTDPTRDLSLVPAHEELRPTGGSVYYLGHGAVAQGSEVLRVELRDGLTGVPLGERHLERGRDYEIDYGAGRILLARALSFIEGASILGAEPLTASPEPVLVADYEHLELAGEGRRVLGGEISGALGPVRLGVGAVQERGAREGFTLLRATGAVPLGPLTLSLEAAQSEGTAIGTDSFGVSDDGGLSFHRPVAAAAQGQALGVRLKGPGWSEAGVVDVSFRRRTPGFSDGAHADRVGLRQLSLRAEQRFGSVVMGVLADDRTAADPRVPFDVVRLDARTLGTSVGFSREAWSARLEIEDESLTALVDPTEPGYEPVTGARTSAGFSSRYRVHENVTLVAGHKQVVSRRGEGLGAVDDTYASAGADVSIDRETTVGVRGGYGPVLGPQVWGHAEKSSGAETWYGGYSVDVDGPHLGEHRVINGARTSEGPTTVFVEDVSAHDAAAIRSARAVGVSQEVGGGLSLSGRYERGVRSLLDAPSPLRRDAGGITASYLGTRARFFGKAELRFDRGRSERVPFAAVDMSQRVFGGGGQVELLPSLRASARANYVETRSASALTARFLEGTGGLALRLEPVLVLLRYAIERELPPPSRGGFAERSLEVVSLMPAFQWGRFGLAAGVHAGWSTVATNTSIVLSGSLRPSVKVVGGLEVAAEVARRSAALDGGELTALRGEVGYRVDERMLFAAGYTVFGFSGLGLSDGARDSRDRAYLRAEVGY